MINSEKYHDELFKVICSGYSFAINKKTNQIIQCKEECSQCMFSHANTIENPDASSEEIERWQGTYNCRDRREIWCKEEQEW